MGSNQHPPLPYSLVFLLQEATAGLLDCEKAKLLSLGIKAIHSVHQPAADAGWVRPDVELGAPFFCCLQVPQNILGIYSDTGQPRDSFGSEYWREGDNINNSQLWWLQCPTPTVSFTMCSVSPTFTTELSTQATIETDLAFLIKPEGWP